MQNAVNTTQTSAELDPKKATPESFLRTLPEELKGVMPENVWSSLSLEQKKEMLRQNGILEKYLKPQPETEVEQIPNAAETAAIPKTPPTAPEIAPAGEVVISREMQEKDKLTEEFKEAVEEFKKVESSVEEVEAESAVKQEEGDQGANTATEPQVSADLAGSEGLKFFGYQPSPQLLKSSEKVSAEGKIEDAATWTATLLQRLFAMFGR